MFSLVPATQMGRNEASSSKSHTKSSQHRSHSPNNRYRDYNSSKQSTHNGSHNQTTNQPLPTIHTIHRLHNSTANSKSSKSNNNSSLPNKQSSIYAGEESYPGENPPEYSPNKNNSKKRLTPTHRTDDEYSLEEIIKSPTSAHNIGS